MFFLFGLIIAADILWQSGKPIQRSKAETNTPTDQI